MRTGDVAARRAARQRLPGAVRGARLPPALADIDGTGIGPFLLILRTDEPRRRASNAVLVHAARLATELIYRDALSRIAFAARGAASKVRRSFLSSAAKPPTSRRPASISKRNCRRQPEASCRRPSTRKAITSCSAATWRCGQRSGTRHPRFAQDRRRNLAILRSKTTGGNQVQQCHRYGKRNPSHAFRVEVTLALSSQLSCSSPENRPIDNDRHREFPA